MIRCLHSILECLRGETAERRDVKEEVGFRGPINVSSYLCIRLYSLDDTKGGVN